MQTLEPTAADLARLSEQLAQANALLKLVNRGARFDGSEADFDRIQAILDSGAVDADATYELQCLGVAFGSALIDAFPGLDWSIIDDEYGRDPTVRYRDTSLVINVLTLISKRVEDGEPVRVRELLANLLHDLPELIAEVEGAD